MLGEIIEIQGSFDVKDNDQWKLRCKACKKLISQTHAKSEEMKIIYENQEEFSESWYEKLDCLNELWSRKGVFPMDKLIRQWFGINGEEYLKTEQFKTPCIGNNPIVLGIKGVKIYSKICSRADELHGTLSMI